MQTKIAAWKNVNSFLPPISFWDAKNDIWNIRRQEDCKMLLFDPGVHFTQQVLSTKVFAHSQHNLACSTRSALPASDAANHCLLQFAPEYGSDLQILAALGFTVEISRRSSDQKFGEALGLNGKVGTGHRSVVDWRPSVGGVARVPQWLWFHGAKINSCDEMNVIKIMKLLHKYGQLTCSVGLKHVIGYFWRWVPSVGTWLEIHHVVVHHVLRRAHVHVTEIQNILKIHV